MNEHEFGCHDWKVKSKIKFASPSIERLANLF